ncbi:hypothetical protein FJO69_00210 [[Mycoplasma] falconis]|uniref:Uncharacterized protein n=1 Tax=[Mycoplasma] falconis TaxID=92403 RepID=A0A501XC19_9BACT|nr:hypothetical protein [[Mycoplasma] falconis]TPE58026.1 hypothetical protein FJO69_00210 [[Mycoplasma] falconis]
MTGFTKMSEDKTKDICGGFAISAILSTILAIVPVAINAISGIVGIVKAASASTGEIKTKDFQAKWDNGDTNVAYGFHYIT